MASLVTAAGFTPLDLGDLQVTTFHFVDKMIKHNYFPDDDDDRHHGDSRLHAQSRTSLWPFSRLGEPPSKCTSPSSSSSMRSLLQSSR